MCRRSEELEKYKSDNKQQKTQQWQLWNNTIFHEQNYLWKTAAAAVVKRNNKKFENFHCHMVWLFYSLMMMWVKKDKHVMCWHNWAVFTNINWLGNIQKKCTLIVRKSTLMVQHDLCATFNYLTPVCMFPYFFLVKCFLSYYFSVYWNYFQRLNYENYLNRFKMSKIGVRKHAIPFVTTITQPYKKKWHAEQSPNCIAFYQIGSKST